MLVGIGILFEEGIEKMDTEETKIPQDREAMTKASFRGYLLSRQTPEDSFKKQKKSKQADASESSVENAVMIRIT